MATARKIDRDKATQSSGFQRGSGSAYIPKVGGNAAAANSDGIERLRDAYSRISREDDRINGKNENRRRSQVDGDDSGKRSEMNPFERGIQSFSELFGGNSNRTMGEREDTPMQEALDSGNLADIAVAFVTDELPRSFLSVGVAPAQAYEAITGRRITERDDDWTIPEENLSGGARLAQAANAVMSAGGPLTGAQETLFKGAASKVTGRAFNDAGQSAIRTIAGDALSEGLEEAEQSLLEDIRYDTFDGDSWSRALESGAWGAAGGAVISGVGNALGRSGRKSEVPADQEIADEQDVQSAYKRNRPVDNGGEVSSLITNRLADLSNERRNRENGSVSLTVVTDDTGTLKPTQAMIGTRDVRNVYMTRDDSNRRYVADILNTTTDDLDRAMASPDWENQIIAMASDAYAARGEQNSIGIGRTPATKGTGIGTADLVGLFKGSGVKANALYWGKLGGDGDGDHATVYLNPNSYDGNYITESLIDPVTGSTPLSWEVLHYSPRISHDDLVDIVSDAWSPYTVNGTTDQDRRIIDDIVTKLENAGSKIEENLDYDPLAKAIYDFGEYAAERSGSYAANGQQAPTSSRKAIESLIWNLQTSKAMDSARGRNIADDNGIPNSGVVTQQILDAVPDQTVIPEPGREVTTFQSSGTLAGATQPVEVYDILGMTVNDIANGNPLWRQQGELAFGTSAVETITQRMRQLQQNGYDSVSVFQALINNAMRVRARGGSVDNSIQTAFSNMVAVNAIERAGLIGRHISTAADVNRFIEEFTKSYDEQVENFNNAMKDETTDRKAKALGVVKKNPIDRKNSSAVFGKIREIFMSKDLALLLDTSMEPQFEKATLEKALLIATSGTTSFKGWFANSDQAVSKFFNDLVHGYQSEKHATATRARTMIDAIAPAAKIVYERIMSGNEETTDRVFMKSYFDAFVAMLDPEVAAKAGIISYEVLLDPENRSNPWVRALVSGNTSSIMNALTSISWTGQMLPIYNRLRTAFKSGDKRRIQRSLDILVSNISNDTLHTMVAQEMAENEGESRLLMYLMDMDISFDQKYAEINDRFAPLGVDLFTDSMTTKASLFANGELNNKLRDFNISATTAKRASYDMAVSKVNKLREVLNAKPQSDTGLFNAVRMMSTNAYVRISSDAFGSLIHNAATIARKNVEKGVAPNSDQMRTLIAEQLVNGGMQSWQERATGLSTGRMSKSEFDSNRIAISRVLGDPNYSVEVYIPGRGSREMNRYELVHDADPSYTDTTGKTVPNNSQMLKVLTKYPQLSYWLSPVSVHEGTNNDGSVNVGLSSDDGIDAAVLEYLTGTDANGNNLSSNVLMKRRSDEIENIVKATMLNDNDMVSTIVYMMGDLSNNLDLQSATESFTRNFNALAKMVTKQALLNPNQQLYSDELSRIKRSIVVDSIEDMQNVLSAAGQSLEMFYGSRTSMTSVANSLARFNTRLQYMMHMETLLQVNGISEDLVSDALDSISFDTNSILSRFGEASTLIKRMADQIVYAFGDPDLYNDIVGATSEDVNRIKRVISANKDKLGDDVYNELMMEADNRLIGFSGGFGFDDIEDSVIRLGDIRYDRSESDSDRAARADAMKKRIEGIARPRALDGVEEVSKIIERSITEGGVSDAELKEIVDTWNRRSVYNTINDIAFLSHSHMNADMLGAMQSTLGCLDRMITDSADAIRRAGYDLTPLRAQYQAGDATAPKFNFFDPLNEIVARYARTASSSGAAPIYVGVNGGTAMLINRAFSKVDPNWSCDVPPKSIPARELLDRIDEFRGYKYYNGTVDPTGRTPIDPRNVNPIDGDFIRMLSSLTDSELDANSYFVFDPKDCSCGACANHSHLPRSRVNGAFSMLMESLGLAGDFTQENMALKLKKAADAAEYAAERVDMDETLVIDWSAFPADPAKMADTVRKTFLDYREKYYEHVKRAYASDNIKKLKMPDDSCRALANLLVVGAKVKAVDQNGNVVTRIVNASEVMDDGKFEAFVNSMADEGYTLQTFKPFNVTIEELAWKIEYETGTGFGGSINSITSADVSAMAVEAMTNWHSYDIDGIAVHDIMDGVNLMGSSYPSYVTGSDLSQRLAAFYEEVYGDNLNLTNRPRRRNTSDEILSDSQRASILRAQEMNPIMSAASFTGNKIDDAGRPENRFANVDLMVSTDKNGEVKKMRVGDGENDGKLIVSAYWGDGDRKGYSDPYASVFRSIGRRYDPYGVGLVQSSDPRMVGDAYNWGLRNHRRILVRNEPRTLGGIQSDKVVGMYYIDEGDIGLVEYVLVDPNITTKASYYAADWQQADVMPTQSDRYIITVQNDAGKLHTDMTESAFLFNEDTVGRMVIPDHGDSVFSANSLFGSRSRNVDRIATASDISRIQNLISNDDWSGLSLDLYANSFPYTVEEMRDRVRQFVDDYQNDFGDRSDYRPEATKGAVLALVVRESGTGIRFAPIIIPNTPNFLKSVSVTKNGDDIAVAYDADVNIMSNDGQFANKASIYGQSMKGMGVTVPADMMPLLARPLGNRTRADSIVDDVARVSRVAGIGARTLRNKLYGAVKMVGHNPFMQQNGSGQYVINDYLRSLDLKPEVYADIIEGNGDIWNEFKEGRVSLFDESKMEGINDIMRDVLINADIHGIPYSLIFESWKPRYENAEQLIHGVQGPGSTGPTGPIDINSRTEINALLSGADNDKVLKFMHALVPNLCPYGFGDPDPNGDKYIFTNDGRIWLTFDDGNGRTERLSFDCAVAEVQMLGVNVEEAAYSGNASRSLQAIQRYGMGRELSDEDAQRIMEITAINTGAFPKYSDLSIDRLTSGSELLDNTFENWKKSIDGYDTSFSTFSEMMWQKRIREIGDTFSRPCAMMGDRGEILTDPYNDKTYGSRIRQKMSELNAALGMGENFISYRMANMLYMLDVTHTYNGGVGQQYGYVKQFEESMDRISRNIREQGLVIRNYDTARGSEGRHPIALLPPSFARIMWQSPAIQNKNNGDYNEFVNRMVEEDRSVIDSLSKIKDPVSKVIQEAAHDWAFQQHGMSSPTNRIHGSTYLTDILTMSDSLESYVFMPETLKKYKEVFERDREKQLAYMARAADAARAGLYTSIESNTMRNGSKVSAVAGMNQYSITVMRNLEALTQIMGVMSPGTVIGNVTDRFLHQGTMSAALAVARQIKFGPYAADVDVRRDIVRAASKNPTVREVWKLRKEAMYLGSSMDAISNFSTLEELRDYVDRLRAQVPGGKVSHIIQRLGERTFFLAGGGEIGTAKQIENYLYTFLAYEKQSGHEWWFEPSLARGIDENGNTVESDLNIAEQMLADNPTRFIMEVNGARMIPSLQNSSAAMNEALKADQASQNAITLAVAYMTRRHPAARFISTTLVNRYLGYATNKAGRVLNWFLPVSSTYHLMCTLAENTQIGQDIGIDRAKFYPSLTAAINADMMHVGFTPALIALVMSFFKDLFEPPEDDALKGNPDEWTFMGMRLTEDWELDDTLSIVKPYLLFYLTCDDGEPRLDLLLNGVSQALYGNPLMDAMDIVNGFIDPTQNFMNPENADYMATAEEYADAKGGSPSYSAWLLAQGTSGVLGYLSQFMTPSFVREYGYAVDDLEHSYKKVYEEGATGRLTEDGIEGATMNTTYLDATLRKATRKNPFLALICNFIMQPETGYLEGQMPLVQVPDNAQVASAEFYSLRDEDGNPLPPEQQEQKIMMAIAMMQSWEYDLEGLAQTGFFLDYETKAAVGDTVWDIYYDLKQTEYQMQQDGLYDYNYYGDYAIGMQEVAKLRSYFDEQKQYWYNFYYDVLWSEPLSRGLQMYNRIKTTFATDADGNVYATGYRPNAWSPIISADGTLENPEGTAGYSGNWETVSAVTGQPMGQRALVPVESGTDNVDVPSLESHSRNGDGNGYSNRWAGGDYELLSGYDPSSYGDEDDKGYPGGRNGYRNYYRRGGGGRSGGRGGYSPSIYSRLPNVYLPSARTMYAERVYGPNYDYLRPNFETKGSREAYKRSDI